MAKRANGEGTVYRKSNSWIVQISINGNRITKSFPTQRKARSWLTEQLRDIDTGNFVEPTDLSLTAWWEKWVNTYKIKAVSESSLSSYDQSKKRISKCAPTLLSTSISSLIRSDIQLAINSLSGQYSDATVKQTYVHISDCLKQAEMDRIIRQSPCIKISMPNRRDHDTKATAMTAEDVTSFINYCKQGPRTTLEGKIDLRDTQRYVYKAASLTILSAGFRRGEVCPLLWDDLSQDGLGINKSLSDSGKLTTPKNDSSVGVVPISDDARAAIDSLPRKSNYIFAGAKGNPISPSTLYHWVVKHTKEVCSRAYTVHDLRHTFISEAAKAGINPKVLQTITRHRSLETLLKVYTHVEEEQRKSAINTINLSRNKSVVETDKSVNLNEK